MEFFDRLLEELRFAEAHPVFVTGAGISIASGIPPFRGTADAVWEQDVMEKGTQAFFHRKPHESWSWYLSRFDKCRTAEPNPAHDALATIEAKVTERGNGFDLVTQNVDGLHLKAGSKNLVECHGTARHMRCTNHNCKFGPPRGLLDWDEGALGGIRDNPCMETVPRCPMCSKPLRPHILWFDESYSGHATYGFREEKGKQAPIDRIMDKMTVLIFVGTSFAVNITDLLMTVAYQRGVPMFNIDPHAEPVDGIMLIQEKSEEFLPKVAAAL